jgi:hypothetical protein
MVMVYKSEAPTVDPTKIQIDIPTMDQGTPPPDFGGDKSGQSKSGDPLQDALKQQQEDADKAGKALEDAFKK